VLELPNTLVAQIESIATSSNVSFSDVFFDFDLLEKCGVKSFLDFPVQQEGVGCLIHSDTLLEIRQQRRKLHQFPLSDLSSKDYLFPIYNITEEIFKVEKKEGFHYFFLYQVIKGRIVKYCMQNFKGLDNLEFINTLFSFENQSFNMLTGTKCKGQLVQSESDDTVVVEQHVKPM
jgi:hypothetical protein